MNKQDPCYDYKFKRYKCDTCVYSKDKDDQRCYCPLIYLNPPQNAVYKEKGDQTK